MTSEDRDTESLASKRLAQAAQEYGKAELWDKCLTSCDQGIALGDEIDTDSWVELRLGFAAAVIGCEDITAELIERAIKGVKTVVTSNRLSLDDKRRGSAYRYLGGLYLQRIAGDRPSNLTSVADYYSKAATIFREDRYPEDWALLKLCIAIALQKRINELGPSFLSSSRREADEAIESLKWSLECCSEAKRVYTGEMRPDLRREADELIESAKSMISRLRSSSD